MSSDDSGFEHYRYWDAGTGIHQYKWTCTACRDNVWRDGKAKTRHEKGSGHVENVQFYEAQRVASQDRDEHPSDAPGPIYSLSAATKVEGPLLELVRDMGKTPAPFLQPTPAPPQPPANSDLVLDFDALSAVLDPDDTMFSTSSQDASLQGISQAILDWWTETVDGLGSDASSSDDSHTGRAATGGHVEATDADEDELRMGSQRIRHSRNERHQDPNWFPWVDKIACILDVMRHLPRSVFSDSQMDVIEWGMALLGINNLPSISLLKSLNADLQELCGIQSIRYEGALGHVYYVNSLADIIAQEMANPRVRPHIHHYPEDNGKALSEAWHAKRWLSEMDPSLLTPMIRVGNRDFFIHEPATLYNGNVCMPLRFFTRAKPDATGAKPQQEFFAQVCRLQSVVTDNAHGYIVHEYDTFEVPASHLSLSLPEMIQTYSMSTLPDPRVILGSIQNSGASRTEWTRTVPSEGNPWREKSKGCRVMMLMMWLYCDDTSGNVSKRWNKHNSFLFTPAGLPREMAQKEYNVHFLSTSNIAPPLEMLDGIADQLEDGQANGIWAWDCVAEEMVLVIPVILAFLGDNPMQSEISCHIGLRGKFFCRCCWVKGKDASDHVPVPVNMAGSGLSDAGSVASEGSSNAGSASGRKSKKAREETMQELVDRAERFLGPIIMRKKDETIERLKTEFTNATTIGKTASVGRDRTASGIKDTFQDNFIQRVSSFIKKLRGSNAQKQEKVNEFVGALPANTMSPIWRIKSLDPHTDTPVEILHVILLGFVKYFWRDVIARLNDTQKSLLATRLRSLDVTGIAKSKLSGITLVQYAGSLTGRDFRIIAQAAPFLLYDLVPKECYDAWIAMSTLVPLIWQPEIEDIDEHLVKMESAIDHFLKCTARWTPRWFNKPKFHLIRHLPEHVRRFGPAILFATEAFESFNAVIRTQSVHSTRRAPSYEIAVGFANLNRVRHLLSGGRFWTAAQDAAGPDRSQRHKGIRPRPFDPKPESWRVAGQHAREIVHPAAGFGARNVVRRFLGMDDVVPVVSGTTVVDGGRPLPWTALDAGQRLPNAIQNGGELRYRKCSQVTLANQDVAKVGTWVLAKYVRDGIPSPIPIVGRVSEIIQQAGVSGIYQNLAHYMLLHIFCVTGAAEPYHLPRLAEQGWGVITPQEALCIVNVQHNCAANHCDTSGTAGVWEERELSSRTVPVIQHYQLQDLLLNTAQMRSAKWIQLFQQQGEPINQRTAIEEGAAREIQARQVKAAVSARGGVARARGSRGGISRGGAARTTTSSLATHTSG